MSLQRTLVTQLIFTKFSMVNRAVRLIYSLNKKSEKRSVDKKNDFLMTRWGETLQAIWIRFTTLGNNKASGSLFLLLDDCHYYLSNSLQYSLSSVITRENLEQASLRLITL